MRPTPQKIVLAPLVLAALACMVPMPASSSSPSADEILEAVRLAYAASVPFEETLELTLELPAGTRSPRRQVYGVGADGSAFFTLSSGSGNAGLAVRAGEGRAVAVWSHIQGRHAEVPSDGNLAAAFGRMEAAQSNLMAPPAVVAAQGAGREEFLDALRFGILAPLEVAGVQEPPDDQALAEVELTAENGGLVLGVDRRTHRLRSIRFTLGEGAGQVRATGHVTFTAGPPASVPPWPDLAASTAVATLPVLEASKYPLGQPAPEVVFRLPDGSTLELADLAGKVVVLDFWATWCVPCWKALEHTEKIAAWAAASGLPVAVLAVDTMERVAGFEDQRDRALGFLRSRGLELPVALDVGGQAFAALYNPGLPSLVIIARDGTLARYYSGTIEGMEEVVRADVTKLLE